jgi:arylsulfatase
MTNFAPEAQCTPSRSALLTGRYAIRSGTHSVPMGVGGDWGLVQWEQTIGDLLSSAGYCCAAYGKWHVGEGRGRWPADKGFTEWYGPPRTYEEALWPTDPWYDPGRDPVSKMLSIKRGEADVTEGAQLTIDVRRDCDTEYLARADRFIRAAADDDTPFFVYFNHSLMHLPVVPRDEFKDSSGQGDWADSLLELDADFGCLLALLDELEVADTTLVVFAGDLPDDRIIDGIDQLDWLTGATEASRRDGFIFWMGPEMYGAKWRNFKLALVQQKYSTDPVGKLSSPRIINLITDPQEREPFNAQHLHTWTVAHFN